MGALTGAVHWWEESKLRVLILTSMALQFFLPFFPLLRSWFLPDLIRFIMWLAYHAGDAVPIYALATLFNRHKADQGDGGGSSSSNTLLEVVWAPILLIHLGGQDGVTAYNIEDNELWSRHLLTAVSQVIVVVYVFCKSWPPGGDKMLLLAAILLFIVGVVKCFAKARAFKKASIYSLVTSTDTGENQTNDGMYKLEKYVKDASDIVIGQQPEEHQVIEEGDPGTVVEVIEKALARLRGLLSSSKDEAAGSSNNRHQSLLRPRRERKLRQGKERLLSEARGEACNKLFLDLSSPYLRRIKIFKKFWGLREDTVAYDSVRGQLASAFLLLYTKLKTALHEDIYKNTGNKSGPWDEVIRVCIQGPRTFLPWAAIGLFHNSHREAYNDIDVKVTYAILCCTAVLETYSLIILFMVGTDPDVPKRWPETVNQYSVVGYFIRNKKHSIKMRVVSLLQCKDFVDQLWCMEPCFTSARITSLVLGYLEDGWKLEIKDAASYRSFNNHSSHWGFNMNKPFDECVLLWHLATYFCFFSSSFSGHKCAFAECKQESSECKAVQCRQMSNYMVYLLFVNPEMLLPGTRRNLFTDAYKELKAILHEDSLFATAYKKLKDILMDNERNRCTRVAAAFKEMKAILMDNERNPLSCSQWKTAPVKEESLMERLITMLNKPKQASEDELKEARIRESKGGCHNKEKLIEDAWALAQRLLDNNKGNEKKMWKQIETVWVEMLCFSASRCRGYLHAKALGKGGEFLSYVWLLLFHMGMETFTDKLQRELETPNHDEAGRNDTAEQAGEVSTTISTDRLQREHLLSQGGNQYRTASTLEISEVKEDVV